MKYLERREATRTRTTMPTRTDQSGAKDTDINVIVGRFLKTGMVPGAQGQAMGGDFTNLPLDLRAYIETARSLDKIRTRLPKELREKPIEELLRLTTHELTTILTPPAAPPATQQGDEE